MSTIITKDKSATIAALMQDWQAVKEKERQIMGKTIAYFESIVGDLKKKKRERALEWTDQDEEIHNLLEQICDEAPNVAPVAERAMRILKTPRLVSEEEEEEE